MKPRLASEGSDSPLLHSGVRRAKMKGRDTPASASRPCPSFPIFPTCSTLLLVTLLGGVLLALEGNFTWEATPPTDGGVTSKVTPPSAVGHTSESEVRPTPHGKDRVAQREQLEREQRQRKELRDVVEGVAGPRRTVIAALGSKRYLSMAQNWYNSVDKVGYAANVLFIASDDKSEAAYRERWPERTVRIYEVERRQNLQGSAEKDDFGSPFYVSFLDRKPEYLLALLQFNVSVLLIDVDIVWKGDPFPFFPDTFDIVVQLELCSIPMLLRHDPRRVEPLQRDFGQTCGCMLMMRPRPQTLSLLHLWQQKVEKLDPYRPVRRVNEQVLLGRAMQDFHDKNLTLSVGALPSLRFPSGCILKQPLIKQLRSRGLHLDTILVHNNWIVGTGAKVSRFRRWGLWNETVTKPRILS